MTATVPTQPTAETAIAEAFPQASLIGRPPAGMSFKELAASADVVTGHELERDKGLLVGVPFVVTSATFRDGTLRMTPRGKMPTNYLSIEVVVADNATLAQRVNSGRMNVAQRQRIIAEEMLVINDGSTGIARQVTAYLHSKGLITVPDGPESGAVGESRYDVYRTDWVKGFDINNPDPRFTISLLCPRGLRSSEYTNDMSPDEATTYYLA